MVIAFPNKKIRIEAFLFGMLSFSPRIFNTVETDIWRLDPGVYRLGSLI